MMAIGSHFRSRLHILRVVGLVALAGLVACDGCNGCGSDPLAVLKTHDGTVEWEAAGKSDAWSKAVRGVEFHIGDALRTGAKSTAQLALFPEGEMRVKENTVIRFLDTPPKAPRRLRVESGQVQVEATLAPIEIATGQGIARLSKGGRARVSAGENEARLLVEVGTIEAIGNGKTANEGQQMTLEIGTVITEEADIDSWGLAAAQGQDEQESTSADDVEQVEDAESGDEDSDDISGGVRFMSDGTLPNLMIEGGQVLTVHDPRPPTKVGFVVPGCSKGARIEIRKNGRWSHGSGSGFIVAELQQGNYQYRGRCLEAATTYKVTGRVRVRDDAGTRRLPQKAAQTTVDADGRKYTVQYQNRLPILRVRWPNAPPSDGYTLELRGEDGTPQQFKANSDASVVLKSGTVDDGIYRYRMRATGGRSSLESTVRISFDNAARSAYLSAPQDGSFDRNQAVEVAGAVLAKARVRSGDREVDVSPSGHFRGTASIAPTEDALVVQVTHPRSGIHYYLRYPR